VTSGLTSTTPFGETKDYGGCYCDSGKLISTNFVYTVKLDTCGTCEHAEANGSAEICW
jgi:hypothetical protein